jgi:hypothetical protein
MHFYVLLAFILSLRATCIPIPAPSQTPPEDHAISSPPGSLAQTAKTGVVVSLSLAGLLGLSIGLTEYISSFLDRLRQVQLEDYNSLAEDKFNRDRGELDRGYQNAGLDILLNLAEKYPGNTKELENRKEEEVDGRGTETGGVSIETEEGIGKARPQEDLEENFEVKSPEEGVQETPEVECEIPMPRLPGFPPLSEPADWYLPLHLHPMIIVNGSTRKPNL